MTNKILFLPLDERPCNYIFPMKLIDSTGKYKLVEPSKDILGNKKIPSDYNRLSSFILDNIGKVDGAVISIDQLLYGGIVPSRIHHLSLSELRERLNLIKKIKEINPNIILYCFLLIMRCPNYSSSDEEPDYYEEYGTEINRLGKLIHQNKEYKNEINDKLNSCLQDYVDRREKNIQLILETIDLLDVDIDFLIIPQDDSQPIGFSGMDREVVLKKLEEKVSKNVFLYPGADEVGMTLITRMINELNGNSKSFYLDFLYDQSKELIPAYENRPLFETIRCQINASGNRITDDKDKADIVLFLNYDRDRELESQGEDDREIDRQSVIDQIVRMKKAKEEGKVVSLVDKFYVNGGYIKYMKILNKEFGIMNLDSYSGWNTSSNTLGTAISFSTIISYFNKSNSCERFLAERIYDDLIYQSYARKYVTNNILPQMGLSYFSLKELGLDVAKIVFQILTDCVGDEFKDVYSKYPLKELKFPWNRMFEVEVQV